MQDALEYDNSPYIKDIDGPYGNKIDGYLAKHMGKGYIFKLKEHMSGDPAKDERNHRIDQMMALKKVMVGL